MCEACEEMREEIERLHALLEGKTQYVDCICPGCPRKVPEAWASGMCQPCASEDCDHLESVRAALEALRALRRAAEAFSDAPGAPGHLANIRAALLAADGFSSVEIAPSENR